MYRKGGQEVFKRCIKKREKEFFPVFSFRRKCGGWFVRGGLYSVLGRDDEVLGK